MLARTTVGVIGRGVAVACRAGLVLALACGPAVGDDAGSGTMNTGSTGATTGSSGGSTCAGATCGADASTGDASTGGEGTESGLGPSGTSTTGETGDVGACRPGLDICCTAPEFCGESGEPAFPQDLECGGPSPCPVVNVADEFAGCVVGLDPAPVFESAAAAQCVLEALRDDTPGSYAIVAQFGGGYGEVRILYQLLGDERVVVEETHTCDVGGSCYEYVAFRKPPAFFDDCLASADPGQHYMCLRLPVEESECTNADDACAPS